MKLFRYRKPSMNNLLGITRAKRQLRRAIGISQIEGYTKPSRIKQRIKQKVGIYSPTMTVVRQTSKGHIPSIFGLFKSKK